MSAAKATPLLDELARRDAALADAANRVREVRREAQEAAQGAAHAREALTAAYADGGLSKSAESKLIEAKVAAEARASEPWAERIAGAEIAATRVRAERDNWTAANIWRLIEEMRPEAERAAAEIERLAVELEQARRAWHAVAQRVTQLIQPTGIDPQTIPQLDNHDAAIRSAVRALRGVPRPLPETDAEIQRRRGAAPVEA